MRRCVQLACVAVVTGLVSAPAYAEGNGLKLKKWGALAAHAFAEDGASCWAAGRAVSTGSKDSAERRAVFVCNQRLAIGGCPGKCRIVASWQSGCWYITASTRHTSTDAHANQSITSNIVAGRSRAAVRAQCAERGVTCEGEIVGSCL
jgi:hypothetical protein